MPHREPEPVPPDRCSGDPVADWADSGIVALTGHPDGPPLVPPGRAATVARQISRRIAAATADSARPLRIDGALLLSERAALTSWGRRGAVSVGGSCRFLPTADGWAAVSCARPDDPLLLGALVGAELPEDPWPAVALWLREHTGAELAERAGLLGLAAGPVSMPVPDRAVPDRAVPLSAVRPPMPDGPPRPWATRPADGLLVVDFSALWAGPLCARLLGLAGARVVKVETPDRPDGARLGHPEFYRLLHAGHRSVVLDPATRGGRRDLATLVEAADVVIEASRPRALARFGLDAAAVAEAGAVWVSITAHGRDVDRVGFGDDIAASAGLVAVDPGGRPLFCGDALADPLTGLAAAELALTAPRDGRGVLVDLSMSALVASTITPGADPVPSRAARREGGAWVLDAAEGPVSVAQPRSQPRGAVGRASASGEDTDQVMRGLGLRTP